MKVRKNKSTPEARAFWEAVAQAAKTVESWPAWKRGESWKTNQAGPGADLKPDGR